MVLCLVISIYTWLMLPLLGSRKIVKRVFSFIDLLVSTSIVLLASTRTLLLTQAYVSIIPAGLNISVGEIAEFHCTVYNFTPDFVIWYLNGTRVQHYSEIDVDELVYLSSLPVSSRMRIAANLETQTLLNNGQVQCEGINTAEKNFETSETVTLMIQGRLYAPTNLSAYFAHDNLYIQWNHPFTLSGIAIWGYQIQVKVINSNADVQVSVSDVLALSDKTVHKSNCTEYQVCVGGETSGGLGETACINQSRMDGVLGSLDDRSVEFKVFNPPKENFLYQFDTISCLNDKQPDDITPDSSGQSEFDITQDSSIHTLYHSDLMFILNLSLPLTATYTHSNIFANISLQDIANHVTDIIITQIDSRSKIQCDFAHLSSAIACLVKITCENEEESSSYHCELYLFKENSSFITSCNLTCSLFRISAFDVKNSGTNTIPSIIKYNVSLNFSSIQTTSEEPNNMTTLDSITYATPSTIQTSPTDLMSAFGIVLAVIDGAIILIFFPCFVYLCILYHRRHQKIGISRNMHAHNIQENVPEPFEINGIELRQLQRNELVTLSRGIVLSSTSEWVTMK